MKTFLPLLLLITLAACSSPSKEELALTQTAYGACKDAFSEAQQLIRNQDEKILLLEDQITQYRTISKTKDSIINAYQTLMGRAYAEKLNK